MKKKMQQVLSVLILSAVLSAVGGMVSAQPLTEVQQRELSSFGIMIGDENGDLRTEDAITRAEAVKMICVSGSIEAVAAAELEPFGDVSQNHWAYKYICAAQQHGIVNGDETGNFNPESPVTNEEIVKMLVCLLGYTPIAEARGGYPAGFTAAAAQIGITTDMSLPVNTAALRGDVAVMICRALDVPLLYEVKEGTFAVADGTNGHPTQTLRDSLAAKSLLGTQ